jgi:hypothetical protein
MSWDDPLDTSTYFPDDVGVTSHEVEKPPFWPLIVQIITIILSIAIFFVSPNELYLTLGLVGYILTPFINVALLATLRAIDLRKRSTPWYDRELGKSYLKISAWLTISGFGVAVLVIWRIAREIAQEFA